MRDNQHIQNTPIGVGNYLHQLGYVSCFDIKSSTYVEKAQKKTFLTIFLLVLIKMFQLDQLKAALDKKCLELGQQKMHNPPSG